MRGMSKPYVVFVPDELWRKFRTGELDHFEYGSEESVAVYADGRRETFNSMVTAEEILRERAEYFERIRASGGIVLGPFVTTLTLRPEHFRGVIVGVADGVAE